MKSYHDPIMNKACATIVSFTCGFALLMVGINFGFYASPFLAWLHPLALGLTGLIALIGLPFVLYQYLTDQMDDSWKLVVASSLIWACLAITEPDEVKVETWTVSCLIGKADLDPTEMAATTRHCREDALVAARDYYEKKDVWLREFREAHDDWPFEEPEIDILIDVFSYTPALDWFNALFGTRLGKKSCTLSFRHMEHGEDPFGIIARQEFENELGLEREDYFRP